MHSFIRSCRTSVRIFAQSLAVVALASLTSAAWAGPVYVGGAANAVGIVNQHPLARGEALYDTQPAATGLYNRNLDTKVPAVRYDADPKYYDATNADTQKWSWTNGAWWCAPTSALSLVKYWATDPRFPNLLKNTDTDRSVLLEIGSFMDVDDVYNIGGNDPNELHLGVKMNQIVPGLLGYFNSRYPGKFLGGIAYSAPVVGGGGGTPDSFGRIYDFGVSKNIPSILVLGSHAVVGMGYDPDKARKDADHYLINDPWDARTNISSALVNKGRIPAYGGGVVGTLADELYGPGADEYTESPMFDFTLQSMDYVEPIDDPELTNFINNSASAPEPASLALLLPFAVIPLRRLAKKKS